MAVLRMDLRIRQGLFQNNLLMREIFVSLLFERMGRTAAQTMESYLKLSFGLIGLVAAIGARAQTNVTTADRSGLLGQRYAELSGSVINPHDSADEGYAGRLRANVPVRGGLDLDFDYNYSGMDSGILSGVFDRRVREHALFTSLTTYMDYRGMRPFAGAGLGYSWSKHTLSFGGATVVDDRDDAALWGLRAGVEIPVGVLTLTPKVTYQATFNGARGRDFVRVAPTTGSIGTVGVERAFDGAFNYGVEAHVWFTRMLGGFADVTYSDPTGGGTQSWIYSAGVRMRF